MLDVGEAGRGEAEHRVGQTNTVVSLMVRGVQSDLSSSLLTVRGLKNLQVLLAADLSPLCDGEALPKEAATVARLRVQLGQPVVLEDAAHGVVRVALGAADVCDAVEAAGGANADGDDIACALDAMVVDDVQIFRKIELLATHWETVQRQYDNLRELNKPPPTEGAYADVHNVDIEWLCPHERVVNEERVDALVDAILRWGCYRKPLLVDKASGSILDGHHRYFSAQRLGLKRVPAALVDYLEDESISVDVWPGDHGVESISKQDVIDMCLSPDVFPPKTSRHTFANPLEPILVPLDELR